MDEQFNMKKWRKKKKKANKGKTSIGGDTTREANEISAVGDIIIIDQ